MGTSGSLFANHLTYRGSAQLRSASSSTQRDLSSNHDEESVGGLAEVE